MSYNDGFNIRAVPWPSNTPVSGNSLIYDGTRWVAANVSGSGGGGSGPWEESAGVVSLANPASQIKIGGDVTSPDEPILIADTTAQVIASVSPAQSTLNLFEAGAYESPGAGATATISAQAGAPNVVIREAGGGEASLYPGSLLLTGYSGFGGFIVATDNGGTTGAGSLEFQTGEVRFGGSPGAAGEILTSNGPGTAPTWQTAPGGGGGDITAVNAGTNLTGGGTSGDVTVSLSSSVIGLTNLQTAVLTASNITGSELNIDHIDFATENATNPTFQTGRLYYDIDTFDLQYNTSVSGTSINLGQQLVVKVKNDTNTTINKGKLVRISGGLGNNPTIATASWENDANSANTLGMLMSTLDHNDFGYVLLNGILLGVNTDTYSAGQTLYLSSSGDYTNIKPVAPRHMVRIGEVVRVGNSEVGSVFVNVQNGYELDELHDVLFSSASNGDLLAWDDSVSLWKNGKTLSGSYTITDSLTASNFVGTLIGSVSTPLYNREIHVANADGDDITGNGTLLKPYKTITKAFQVVGGTGEQIVVHPGTYTAGGTISSANVTVCAAQGSNGGEVYLSGAIVVSQSASPASSIRFFGLSIGDLTHNGVGGLYLDTCKINNFSKVSDPYCEINDCDINQNATITGNGITAFNSGKQCQFGTFTIANTSPTAVVSIKNSINCTAPKVDSGFLGIEGSTVYAKATGYAVSASVFSRVDLVNNYLITPLGTISSASLPGQYSIVNTVYNKTSSVLGTSLNATSDFQIIRSDSATITNIDYTPANSSDWSAPAPTTIKEAIDRLAAQLFAISGAIP